MSTNFSANQYEKSFVAQRLQNWQIPKNFKEHPTPREGGTVPISNDRGHLLDGVARSKSSPWGNFKGTWHSDMDCRKTVHSQTLATLKSEGSNCLNNQVKKTAHLKQKELTLTNKEQNKIFKDFSKMRPDRSRSPIGSPTGDSNHLAEANQDIKVASPVQAPPESPIEFKAASPVQVSARGSPVAGTPKRGTPVTPTLEDKPVTPVKPSTPMDDRKYASPLLG